MNNWNQLDFFIFLILAINFIQGLVRGATREIIALMCLCFAIIVTIKFTVPVETFLNKSPAKTIAAESEIVQNFLYSFNDALNNGQQMNITPMALLNRIVFCISLVLCFTAAYSVTAAGLSVSGFVEVFSFPYAALNRKIGGALGFLRGYVVSLIVIICLMTFYAQGNNFLGSEWVKNSAFVNLLYKDPATKFFEIIKTQDPDRYRDIFENRGNFTVQDMYDKLDGGQTPEVQQFKQMLNQPEGGTQQPDTSNSPSGDFQNYNGPMPAGAQQQNTQDAFVP